MFSFFTGRRFCNAIAKEIGINKALLSTALLECGTTWYHLKILKQTGLSAKEAGIELLPNIIQGLDILVKKFGPQKLITQANCNLNEFILRLETSNDASNSITSSIYSEGRYELSVLKEIQLGTNDGQPQSDIETFIYLSNDLDSLKAMGLMQKLDGNTIQIKDTETGDFHFI